MRIGKYLPFPSLQRLLKSRRSLKERTYTHVAAEMKKEKNPGQHSLLTSLIDTKDPETGEALTQDDVSSEAFAFLVAGSHTTSGTLTLLFYYLLHNSLVAKKLTDEIVTNLPTVDGEEVRIPAYTGLESQLPYAMACIRENFRIAPVFTMPFPRTVCDPSGADIDGVHVPYSVSHPFPSLLLILMH